MGGFHFWTPISTILLLLLSWRSLSQVSSTKFETVLPDIHLRMDYYSMYKYYFLYHVYDLNDISIDFLIQIPIQNLVEDLVCSIFKIENFPSSKSRNRWSPSLKPKLTQFKINSGLLNHYYLNSKIISSVYL